MEPVEIAFNALWPGIETVSLLDEALSIDRQKQDELSDHLESRILSLAEYAEGLGSNGILYTCSAFGTAIERAASNSNIPVLKPNEAMFERAIAEGDDVVMLYTFEPAMAGMLVEFEEEVQRCGSQAKLRGIYVEDALQALKDGDAERHNQLIADKAKQIEKADVILLAHFSMARALDSVESCTSIPVLSSPHTAVEKMKAVMTARNAKDTAC